MTTRRNFLKLSSAALVGLASGRIASQAVARGSNPQRGAFITDCRIINGGDYGIRPGTGDFNAAFQRAGAAAGRDGTVLIPPGRYHLTKTIDLTNLASQGVVFNGNHEACFTTAPDINGFFVGKAGAV